MDSIVDYVSSYAVGIDFQTLPAQVVHQAKRHLLDSLGCAVWGYPSEPGKIARGIADRVTCSRPATIIGSGHKTTPELAAFANGTMLRYPEFNDTYMGPIHGCHPSDNVASVLACADSLHASGRSFITAVVLAYEVACRLRDVAPLKNFDSSTLGAISSAVGCAKILGLSSEQTAQAIFLAVASNISLRQTRIGEVSMWKGCAWANACQNGLFAARLAGEGMTGPDAIFEGKGGFFNAVSGPFQLGRFGGAGQSFRIMDTSLKHFPTGFYSQTAIDGALKLRSKLKSLQEIAEVNIKTMDLSFDIMAGDQQKWHPHTRETADHSLPYVVAVALIHGSVGFEHFSEESLVDPQLNGLIQKIKVVPWEECTKGFPQTLPNIIEITTNSGNTLVERVEYHRGHARNPMSDDEIERKFLSLSQGLLSPSQIELILDTVWNLEKVEDMTSLPAVLGI